MTSDFVSLVEARLTELLKKEKLRAPSKEAKLLLDRIRILVMRGGKRFRPTLLAMTYTAYGGKDLDQLVDLGVALELYHQFLLIHDDIIDQDNERYSGPNITGFYLEESKDNRQAESVSLLAGDLLFSLANQTILASKYTDANKIKLLELIHSTNITTIYGQQLDMFNLLNKSDIDRKKFELISSLKTAQYSTLLPMRAAALILNLPKEERLNIDQFGLIFGILFQLADDYKDNPSKDLTLQRKYEVLSKQYYDSCLKVLGKLKIHTASRSDFVRQLKNYRI